MRETREEGTKNLRERTREEDGHEDVLGGRREIAETLTKEEVSAV